MTTSHITAALSLTKNGSISTQLNDGIEHIGDVPATISYLIAQGVTADDVTMQGENEFALLTGQKIAIFAALRSNARSR
jgi:hypothetical protein